MRERPRRRSRTNSGYIGKGASLAGPKVLGIRHIGAIRELERSRLGGRSLCVGGAASESCKGGSGSVGIVQPVTVV
jgi:hypothetical protein